MFDTLERVALLLFSITSLISLFLLIVKGLAKELESTILTCLRMRNRLKKKRLNRSSNDGAEGDYVTNIHKHRIGSPRGTSLPSAAELRRTLAHQIDGRARKYACGSDRESGTILGAFCRKRTPLVQKMGPGLELATSPLAVVRRRHT